MFSSIGPLSSSCCAVAHMCHSNWTLCGCGASIEACRFHIFGEIVRAGQIEKRKFPATPTCCVYAMLCRGRMSNVMPASFSCDICSQGTLVLSYSLPHSCATRPCVAITQLCDFPIVPLPCSAHACRVDHRCPLPHQLAAPRRMCRHSAQLCLNPEFVCSC